MITFGVDPGLKGGVAILENRLPVWAGKLPYIGKQVDVSGLRALIEIYQPDEIRVERQSIRQRQAGAMTIGSNFGRILAVVELSGVAHRVPTPSTWKAKAKIRAGLSGKAAKEESFLVAQRLWGKAFDRLQLRPTQDGPVEALLIAYYG